MRFGETFMLAGLTEVQDTAQTFKTPFLGELPYIGAAFRRVSYQTTETELVILVTPVLAGAMQDCQMPPGGPGLFTEQPTDRELYWYGLLEVPSYGGVCGGNCGQGAQPNGYPPPILDFDMGPHGPSPMITPVPIQEMPPVHEQFSPAPPSAPPAPPAPASMHRAAIPMSPPPTMSSEPVGGSPVAPAPVAPMTVPSTMMAPPAPSMAPMQLPPSATQQPATQPSAGPAPNGTAARWWYNPSVRQVSAQSSSATPDGARQASYTTTMPAGSASSVVPASAASVPSSAVRSGLYEPQTGLYVPAGASP
jgi:pilus assembly protein CpaC